MTNAEQARWHASEAEKWLSEKRRNLAPQDMGRASTHATLALYYQREAERGEGTA